MGIDAHSVSKPDSCYAFVRVDSRIALKPGSSSGLAVIEHSGHATPVPAERCFDDLPLVISLDGEEKFFRSNTEKHWLDAQLIHEESRKSARSPN